MEQAENYKKIRRIRQNNQSQLNLQAAKQSEKAEIEFYSFFCLNKYGYNRNETFGSQKIENRRNRNSGHN